MPLIKSDTESATRSNFRELRKGAQYARTRKKLGKRTAQRQMIAIALKTRREAAKKKQRRKRG